MTQKEEILTSLEASLKLLERALMEREQEQRELLYACKVSKIDDINDLKMFKIGAELDNQIDTIKDLIDELKHQLKYISVFKEV